MTVYLNEVRDRMLWRKSGVSQVPETVDAVIRLVEAADRMMAAPIEQRYACEQEVIAALAELPQEAE